MIREQSALEQRHSTVIGQSGRKGGNQGISESGGNGMFNMMRESQENGGVNLGSIGEEQSYQEANTGVFLEDEQYV